MLHEVTVTSARDSCAYVVTRIEMRGHELVKSVRTEFLSKVIRLDTYAVGAEGITRSTRWQYPNDVQIDASYTADGRTLTVTRGGATVELSTTGQWTGRVLQAVTQRTDGADEQVTIIGSRTVGPGKSSTVIGVVQPKGPFQYGTVTTRPDGVIVATQVVPFENGVGAGQTITDVTDVNNPSITSNAVRTQQNGDGTTTVTAGNSQVDQGGVTTSAGTASTTAGGGFSSYTETGHTETGQNEVVTQRSSYVNDGTGNESQTTVTYQPNGSFTIDTTSKDSNGNTTEKSETSTRTVIRLVKAAVVKAAVVKAAVVKAAVVKAAVVKAAVVKAAASSPRMTVRTPALARTGVAQPMAHSHNGYRLRALTWEAPVDLPSSPRIRETRLTW